jgi:guanylate kinase
MSQNNAMSRTSPHALRAKKNHPANGHLFIISAPSGAGKTTLCKAALRSFPDLHYSISHTTRKPRPGERHGIDYFFLDEEQFRKRIQEGKWAEWARIYDHYYGTCSDYIDGILNTGDDILLDIDAQGTRQTLQHYPESVTIFIMPPSLDVLRERLQARATDSREEIAKRLRCAEEEMAESGRYQHVIVNDDLNKAIDELLGIMKKYRLKR